MAELWNDPEITRWWLPNDEGYPSIIQSIRTFIEERTSKPRNQSSEDVRTMKGLFSKMNIYDESPTESQKNSPETSSSVGEPSAQYSPPANGLNYGQVSQSQAFQSQAVNAMFDESMTIPPMWEAKNVPGQDFYEGQQPPPPT